ncbi:MAG: rhodanese-like domain-containing protein [Kiritimatiellae bacterium]|nr:rhodanese-like domain-containing protein [Kiritimatiellia bacterium]
MWPFRRSSPELPTVQPEELVAAMQGEEPPLVFDVRTPAEFAAGHIPGAVNLPHTEVARRGVGEPGWRGRRIVVTCAHGGRARAVAAALRDLGCRDVRLLEGHMSRWCAEGRPLKSGGSE